MEERRSRHESPQVIVLRQGRAIWSASHDAITAQAVATALQEA
jgi:bacillithiol system protein YtxJ